MLIKSRNFSPTKCERNWDHPDGQGLGWAPGSEKRFEGQLINKIRYDKNFEQALGTCKKCDKFTGITGTKGEHCSLPINERCQN